MYGGSAPGAIQSVANACRASPASCSFARSMRSCVLRPSGCASAAAFILRTSSRKPIAADTTDARYSRAMPQTELQGARGRLVVHEWPNPEARFVALLSHGYGEHAARYEHV